MAQSDIGNSAEQNKEDTLKGKYLIFSMGEELYGIEIRYITEIIGVQPITEVPEMPDYIKGITNLRGKIIPVIDARLRFRKAVRAYDDRTCIVVLDTDGIPVGLVVDSVSEVLSMEDEDIAPPPEFAAGRNKYIQGIGKSGGVVSLLLDCRKILRDQDAAALGNLA